MQPAKETAIDVVKVLDSLAALSADLACNCNAPPHKLVLSASRVQDACTAIDEAVVSLKRILVAAEEDGGGPVAANDLDAID